MSAKFELEPTKFLQVVKATIFEANATEEELIAFLVICNKYGLDPFRKEIYAFRQGGKVQPIVGIDGWYGVVNERPEFDGYEYEVEYDKEGKLFAITCKMFRKDRTHAMGAPEYLAECRRNTPAWNTMPHRMLRHRAYIQTARSAFGISGIMDPDEFEQMVETQARVLPMKPPPATLADLTKTIRSEQSSVASAGVTPPLSPASSPAQAPVEATTPPAAPVVSSEAARAPSELNILVRQARAFEEMDPDIFQKLCVHVGCNPANLRVGGVEKIRPLIAAIKDFESTGELPTPVLRSVVLDVASQAAPPAPTAPPTVLDQIISYSTKLGQVLYGDIVKAHGGVRGQPNFSLGSDGLKALLLALEKAAASEEVANRAFGREP